MDLGELWLLRLMSAFGLLVIKCSLECDQSVCGKIRAVTVVLSACAAGATVVRKRPPMEHYMLVVGTEPLGDLKTMAHFEPVDTVSVRPDSAE